MGQQVISDMVSFLPELIDSAAEIVKHCWRRFPDFQCAAWIAEIGKLHRIAEPVMWPAALLDQLQIVRRESVVTNDFLRIGRRIEECRSQLRGQKVTGGHRADNGLRKRSFVQSFF
jgi:hypothetical protein